MFYKKPHRFDLTKKNVRLCMPVISKHYIQFKCSMITTVLQYPQLLILAGHMINLLSIYTISTHTYYVIKIILTYVSLFYYS